MRKQIDDLVLLAILQNQIKNAVDENKVDTSKFASVKSFKDLAALSQEEINDIKENFYDFLYDETTNRLFLLCNKNSEHWAYVSVYPENLSVTALSESKGITGTRLRELRVVEVNESGSEIYSDLEYVTPPYTEPQNLILKSRKYPNVIFYANYYSRTADSIIYRFSSGIILDSSTETPQYKIVFANFNVRAQEITFVEKVLS